MKKHYSTASAFFPATLFCLLLKGCAYLREYKGPDGDVPTEFTQVQRLESIEGKYHNAGDPEGYFSQLLWGEYKGREISNIGVRVGLLYT